MATAFVLISCVLGKEEEIIESLKRTDSVKEAHGTSGAYDVIATVKNSGKGKIQDTIKRSIEDLEHVRSTLTLIGTT